MSTEQRALRAVLPAMEAAVDEGMATAAFSPTLLLPAPSRASRRDRIVVSALRAGDTVALALAVGCSVALGGEPALAVALYVPVALVLVQLLGLYARDAVVFRASMLDELPRLLQAQTVAGALLLLLADADHATLTAAWAASCMTVPATRKLTRAAARRVTADERVLILGSGRIADLVAEKMRKHPETGVEIVGCLDVVDEPRDGVASTLPHLGILQDVDRVIERERIDSVIIAFSAVPHEDLLDAIRRCKRKRVKISVVPRLFEVIGSRVELHDIEGLTMLGLQGPSRSRGALMAKRVFDVLGSACALVLLSPVLLVIAVLVKLSSPGPVLFRQERIGRGQRPFSMVKFRTMVDGADAQKADVLHLNEFAGGAMFKIARDPRVTRIGGFLRATSLDELPQFVNVLRGEMSIVGPRPLIREENDAVLGWHRTRLDLTPGLTGPWQVMGRQNVPFDEMVKLDYLYVAEWSFWHDVKLALRTVPVILRRTGV